MANFVKQPQDLAIFWASLKIDYEEIISQFVASDNLTYKAFAEICRRKHITAIYNCIVPNCGIDVNRCEAWRHARKTQRLLLQTAKEFWLPRCEILENDIPVRIPSNIPCFVASAEEVQTMMTKLKFKRRLGGFYLLWTMFWNQPSIQTRRFERIKINEHDMETFQAFAKDLAIVRLDFCQNSEAERKKFIKEVRYMFSILLAKRAFDICIAADTLTMEDRVYLNTKYSGKAEKLEWEKSLKERLLFHPVIVQTVRSDIQCKTLKLELENLMPNTNPKVPKLVATADDTRSSSSVITQENNGMSVHDVVKALLATKLEDASTSVHKPCDDNNSEESQSENCNSTEANYLSAIVDTKPNLKKANNHKKLGIYSSLEAKAKLKAEGVDGQAEWLRNILKEFVTNSPYSLKDLLPRNLYEEYIKLTKLSEGRMLRSKQIGFRVNKRDVEALKKAFGLDQEKIDTQNPDHLIPVLRALGISQGPESVSVRRVLADLAKRKQTNAEPHPMSETRLNPVYEFLFANCRDEVDDKLKICYTNFQNFISRKTNATAANKTNPNQTNFVADKQESVPNSQADIVQPSFGEYVLVENITKAERDENIEEMMDMDMEETNEVRVEDLISGMALSDDDEDEENVKKIIQKLSDFPALLSRIT